jgi:hypothetical protein
MNTSLIFVILPLVFFTLALLTAFLQGFWFSAIFSAAFGGVYILMYQLMLLVFGRPTFSFVGSFIFYMLLVFLCYKLTWLKKHPIVFSSLIIGINIFCFRISILLLTNQWNDLFKNIFNLN